MRVTFLFMHFGSFSLRARKWPGLCPPFVWTAKANSGNTRLWGGVKMGCLNFAPVRFFDRDACAE